MAYGEGSYFFPFVGDCVCTSPGYEEVFLILNQRTMVCSCEYWGCLNLFVSSVQKTALSLMECPRTSRMSFLVKDSNP